MWGAASRRTTTATALIALLAVGVAARPTSQLDPQTASAVQATLVEADFQANARTLTLYDRRGHVERLLGDAALYRWPVLSPDATRVAVIIAEHRSQRSDLWVIDLVSGARTRLTSDVSEQDSPVWSSDGVYLAYISRSDGLSHVYRRPANGTGDEELLFQDSRPLLLTDWSRDGRFLSVSVVERGLDFLGDRSGLYVLRIDQNSATEPRLIALSGIDNSRVFGARFSPDGQFIAYRSRESGTTEIWARRFDESGNTSGARQVSRGGALGMASWRRDGQELYFLSSDLSIMAMGMDAGVAVTFGQPRVLFKAETLFEVTDYPFAGAPEGLGDVSPDGQHILLAVPPRNKGRWLGQRLTIFDRQGTVLRRWDEAGEYIQPQFSPDGTRVAAYRDRALWTFDIASGKEVQITPGSLSYSLAWSPDGRRIAYVSYRDRYSGVYAKASSGVGGEQLLYRHAEPGAFIPLTDWSHDGRLLSFNGGNVLWAVRLGRGPAVELVGREFNTFGLRFSQDSRFVAYVSDESGRNEVYVRPFEKPSPFSPLERTWQISTGGGLGLIQWREDSRELYYLAADGWVMAVDVSTRPTFRASPARPLFQVPDTFPLEGVFARSGTNAPDCSCGVYGGCEQGSISRDGQRVVLALPVAPDRREVSVSPDVLARIAGRYDLVGREVVLHVADDHLVFQAGRGAVRMFASSANEFFMKATNAELEFFRDQQGEVSHFLLYQGGAPTLGIRMRR